MSETKPAPSEQSDAPDAASAQELADFGAGFDGGRTSPGKPTAQPEPADDPPDEAAAEEKPEYAQLTTKELAELRAAAAKTASYDNQLARLNGGYGNIQKQLAEQREAAKAERRKVEVPKEAFSEMERDFPELAAQIRGALEHTLSGMPRDSADADPGKLEALLAQYNAKRELEILEDAYPDWRTITGAVNAAQGEQPDPNNAFRKWLATKDAGYQTRVNTSENAAVIGRAIRNFQRETTSQQPKTGTPPRDSARVDRIRAAVQPRGDRAGGSGPNTEQDEFEAGFNASR